MTAAPGMAADHPRATAGVVMPTVLRPSLLAAARSVFAQDIAGPIHLLIGVDQALGPRAVLEQVASECPSHVRLTVVDPGYSTSARHGGLYQAYSGGALRTVLSYLADSPFVAYLDDDNVWAPSHLASLRRSIDGKAWAYSFRWMIEGTSGAKLHVDCCKAIGPMREGLRSRVAPFVDTNELMVDKIRAHHLLPVWASGRPEKDGRGNDRLLFDVLLATFPDAIGATGLPTVLYTGTIDCMRWMERIPVVPSPAVQTIAAVMGALYAHAPTGARRAADTDLPPRLVDVLGRARPRSIAVVGSAAARAASALAEAAERHGQRPDLVWVDPDGLEEAAIQGVRPDPASVAIWPWPLVQTPRMAARFLAVHGVRLDLAWLMAPLSAAREDGSLANWWALLRDGGALVAAGDDGAPLVAIKKSG